MRTYKLAAVPAVSANASASIQVVRDGYVRNVRWSLLLDATVDNAYGQVELSMVPTSQIGVHDTVGVIDQIGQFVNAPTVASIDYNGQNVQRDNLAFPVKSGERFYINCVYGNISGSYITCFVDVEER